MAEPLNRSDRGETEADRELRLRIEKVVLQYEPLRATEPELRLRVEDGRVDLRGRVRTRAMKEIAEYRMLRLVEGVRAVRNDLVADPEVVRAVADALAADDRLAPLCIRVDARNGEVVLRGDVPHETLVERAEEVASAIPTVAAVDNRLRVRPEAPATTTNGATDPGTIQELSPEERG